STTKDLKNWTHHPIAIGIDEDWEKSICTGSVAYHDGKFYAFYATRLINADNRVNEQLSYAISTDGINFVKQKPNPFYTSAPGYSQRHFRDPKVVVDTNGTFHLFITSVIEDYSLSEGRGCLVHLTSKDLKEWKLHEPLISGQRWDPECPDHFLWNGWYYLVYGQVGDTYYLKSRSPYGPWEFPESQALIEQWVNVAKTAAFTGNRRIVAGWVPTKREYKDYGREQFGGSVVLREAIQLPNGDLATKFPPEAIPATGAPINFNLVASENATKQASDQAFINASGAIGGAYIANVPYSCRVTLEIEPTDNSDEFGLFIRTNEKAGDGYKLSFSPKAQIVRFGNDAWIESVGGLDKIIKLDIVMKEDIIDVSINNERCIVNRLPEKKGGCLWFFVRNGNAKFSNIKVYPLL
ncbi:MAG: family 43 glycosylhydrolase, partial [Tannerella sp.]|nr:family 43 glycosylhydrolase [Tannerella sp.]